MNVIIAGEESGVERDAFASLGHNAWSCDLKPSRSPHGLHYRGSWHDIWWESFDLGVMHPECTHIAVSGAKHFPAKRADGRQQAAINEFLYLANAPVYASCVEQPVGIMSTLYRKPEQIVQPWMFGHWESKATCYWLKNLPRLVPLYRTVGECREALGLPANAMPEQKVWKAAPTKDPEVRRQLRSASFSEIAEAMAAQWGMIHKVSNETIAVKLV